MADKEAPAQDVEALKEDVARLREDLSRLATTIKDLGTNEVTDARKSIQNEIQGLQAELDRALGKARKRGEDTVDNVEGRVVENPLLSLLAAFGIGLFLGGFMRR